MVRGLIGLALCLSASARTEASAGETIVVAQDGSGDVLGNDDRALQTALDRAAASRSTVVVAAGRYLLRRSVRIPAGCTLRGRPGAVLAVPRPVRVTRAAAVGERRLFVSDAGELLAGTGIELAPPQGTWPAGTGPSATWLELEAVEGNTLVLRRPLELDVPLDARLGHHEKMLLVSAAENVTIENLVLDGGRVADIPMLGHQKRSGVWVDSHFRHESGAVSPPSRDVIVRNCTFRNFYGRGVAFYNVTDSAVLNCTFTDIADEAIDFDHYTFRCTAAGNRVTRAVFGVALNDAADCNVFKNRITACRVGLTMWWLASVDPKDVNRRNAIHDNVILGSEEAAVRLGKNCVQNRVENNATEGPIEVEEADNLVRGNSRK